MGDEQPLELKKRYHPFAAAMCTISVFHMKSVLNVVSRHFGVAFNIPRHNVGIYASKLISYRFFLGMVGSFFELMLYFITVWCLQGSYEGDIAEIKSAIEGQKGGIENAIGAISTPGGGGKIETHLKQPEVNKKLAKWIVKEIKKETGGMATEDEKKKPIIAGVIAKEIETLMGGMFEVAATLAKETIKTKLSKPISQNIISDKIWLQFHIALPDFIAVQIEGSLGSIPSATNEGEIAQAIGQQAGAITKAINPKADKISKLITGSINASDVTNITGAITRQKSQVKGAITHHAPGNSANEIREKADKIADEIVKIKDIQTKVKQDGIPENRMVGLLTKILKAKADAIAENLGEDADGDGNETANIIKNQIESTYKKHIQGDIAKSIIGALPDAEGTGVRRVISMISFILMFIARVIFLRKLYTSSSLGYHAYVILNVEGFSWGVVQMTLFPLTPMHSAVTTMSIDVSTMTIFFFQLMLDAFLFHRPLYMIKIEMWIIVFWNLAAIPVWGCSIYKVVETAGAFYNYQGRKDMDALMSPFWMFFFVSLLKDYMFPGVIPYALLTPDQAHLTNIVFPPFYIMGSLLVIILDETDKGKEGWFGFAFSPGDREMNGFKEWDQRYHAFWVLYIPQVVNYYYAHKAIHTTGAASKFILGNRGFVLFMAIVMQLGYSILESLSFVCVANYTFSFANHFYTGYLVAHNFMAEVYRFIFSKTSVGYNNLRNRYGLGMNVVHPHRLRRPGAWYWIKESCVIAYKDTMNDMRMNIGDYL